MDHDYRIGLWYGLFHPTPILPMTWWWEFFDERNMTPYLRSVAEINNRMLEAGGGSYELIEADAGVAEAYAVRCGETWYVILLNDTGKEYEGEVVVHSPENETGLLFLNIFDPEAFEYQNAGDVDKQDGKIIIPVHGLENRQCRIYILTNSK